jgi:hypothetical protein
MSQRRGLAQIEFLVIIVALISLVAIVVPPTSLPLVPASGKILRPDGMPVKYARVDFWPQNDPATFIKSFKTLPFGITNEKGEFEMLLDAAKAKGIPPEKYRVTVLDPEEGNPIKRARLPEEYTKDDATPWEVTIPPKGKTDILLQIGSK